MFCSFFDEINSRWNLTQAEREALNPSSMRTHFAAVSAGRQWAKMILRKRLRGICSVFVVYLWRWCFHRAQYTQLWEKKTFLKWFVIWKLSLYWFFSYPNQQVMYLNGILYCNFQCLLSSVVSEIDSFTLWCTLCRWFHILTAADCGAF